MSRPYDWTLFTVVTIISIAVHTISIELFGPQSALHQKTSEATKFGAAEKADLWFEILSIWAPLIVIGGMFLWCLFREYRRQVATSRVTTARPP